MNNTSVNGKPVWTKKNIDKDFPVVKNSDKNILLRTLRSDDVEILSEYFLGLSDRTKQLYGPHRFDRETAIDICANVEKDDMIRFIAITEEEGRERLIAYFILKLGVLQDDVKRYEAIGLPLYEETDCMLAPSTSDSHQSTGIGSIMMKYILEHIPALGRHRMVLWGGVQGRNERAVHFYTKFGFKKANEFICGDILCYDMLMDL